MTKTVQGDFERLVAEMGTRKDLHDWVTENARMAGESVPDTGNTYLDIAFMILKFGKRREKIDLLKFFIERVYGKATDRIDLATTTNVRAEDLTDDELAAYVKVKKSK